MEFARGECLLPGCVTNAVKRFRDEQVLIPGDEITGSQAFPEKGRELIRLDFQRISSDGIT